MLMENLNPSICLILSGYNILQMRLIKNLSLDQNLFSGPWNFGPPTKSNESVKYVCNKIVNKWGNDFLLERLFDHN